jgi:hypothetical protein
MHTDREIRALASDTIDQRIENKTLPFVALTDVPSSATLTDEQIEEFKEGHFTEGEFIGLKNPVFFPAKYFGNRYYSGMVIGLSTGSGSETIIGSYLIDTNDNSIVLTTNRYIDVRSVYKFNGKEIPVYPSDSGTFVLKCVNGTLTWVEEI